MTAMPNDPQLPTLSDRRVLLTGAAGSIGRMVRPLLAPHVRELRLVDRQPVVVEHPHETAHVVDLIAPEACDRAVAGIDAIVHMAGCAEEGDWGTLLRANVLVVIALWDAAVRAGVDRIVSATSNHATGFHERAVRIDGKAEVRPDTRYGVTKVFMEALASLHADKHGLRGFGIRIGRCDTEPRDARALSHWVHPQDLAALVRVGLEADYLFEIVYGVSANARSWWDNARALELGYRPRHSADAFIAALAHKVEGDPVAERYQGGPYTTLEFTGDPSRPARRR
jgi:uronate dehydrogenase